MRHADAAAALRQGEARRLGLRSETISVHGLDTGAA